LFARCLSYYWVQQPAAQAVRNRANYLLRKINETVESRPNKSIIRILSVASGPAMEWQKFIESGNLRDGLEIQVDLLDQDENALKHAQNRMKVLLAKHKQNSIKFNYLNKSIKNIITKGLGTVSYDLIYTAGLFDYFSDPVAKFSGQKLFDGLQVGGSLIIGNFNIENPNSTIMDLALDWQLIYRSESDMLNLFSSLSDKVWNDKEDLGINLFCNIEKNN
jgi:hypothetical protein